MRILKYLGQCGLGVIGTILALFILPICCLFSLLYTAGELTLDYILELWKIFDLEDKNETNV